MDGVGAFALAPFRHLDGVGEHVALLLPRNDIVSIDGAELDLQMEISADTGTDGADHFQQEARAVLQGPATEGGMEADTLWQREARAVRGPPAILVGAIVDAGREKLGEQVAVGCMQLDAVEAGLARAPGAGSERVHELLDLWLAGGPAEKTVQRFLAAG